VSGALPSRETRARGSGGSAAALAFALTLSGCADRADPLRASAINEAPLAPLTLIMIPSVGEHVFEPGPEPDAFGLLTPGISWTVDFTAPDEVAELWVRIRLLREDGAPCLSGGARVGRVARGNRYVASGDRYVIVTTGGPGEPFCSDVFRTVAVDVNLLDGAGPEAAVVRGYSFAHFYYFERMAPAAGEASP
jgi:hypothetical protein